MRLWTVLFLVGCSWPILAGAPAPNARIVLPPSGKVACNAAIVIYGHFGGELGISMDGGDLPRYERRFWTVPAPNPAGDNACLLQPVEGTWPAGGEMQLTIRYGESVVSRPLRFTQKADRKPPVFGGYTEPPGLMWRELPMVGRIDELLFHVGGFKDEHSPLMLIRYSLSDASNTARGSREHIVWPGQRHIAVPPMNTCRLVDATVTDTAGNTARLPNSPLYRIR